MPAEWDDEFAQIDDPLIPPPRKPSVGLWIAVVLLIVAVAIALYVFFRREPVTDQTTASATKPSAATASGRPLGGDAAPIDLPPLDQSDALVRQLVRQLSTHPQVAAWLATEGLIRNFTVVVGNIAEGKTPAPVLKALRPSGRFEATGPFGDTRIEPRSYGRYTGLADAVASIDPAASARLYTLLKPRIEEAYAELGNPDMTFDRTLERAIVQLLQTPIPTGPIRVEPQGATGYRFADGSLEELTGAQKQLLRMGPQNGRTIQQRLRAIALALNIPAERLPELP